MILRTTDPITRRLGRAAAVSLLVAAAATGGATTAYAGSNESVTVQGGTARFRHHGEILTAIDSLKDGRCVTGQARYIGAGPNAPVITKSAEACGAGKITSRNLSIGEGDFVLLRVCYTGGGTAAKCSDWQEATA